MKTIQEPVNGWYFYTPTVDYFFVTNQKRKSDKMMKAISQKLQEFGANYVCNIANIYSLSPYVQKATYEAKLSEIHGVMHSICGDIFGAGDFEKNKHCEVIKL